MCREAACEAGVSGAGNNAIVGSAVRHSLEKPVVVFSYNNGLRRRPPYRQQAIFSHPIANIKSQEGT